jgi:hypothetical protein
MENHNWTQPATDGTAPSQIFNNPDAPFINSLTNPASPNSESLQGLDLNQRPLGYEPFSNQCQSQRATNNTP